ncbi:MAG: hypothetical protein M3347_16695, partial [Armatimonadota bacterium]|nr:hypothetical protein [Armatimonadota bacterium]
DWDEDTHHVLFDGKEIQEAPVMIDERAYLPITTLVNATGALEIKVNDPQTHTIIVGRKAK